jgi:hypothetical protein
MVEGRHEVCGDLCRFLLGYGIGRILFTGLKNIFQRAAIFGRASVTKSTDFAGTTSKSVIGIVADQSRRQNGVSLTA